MKIAHLTHSTNPRGGVVHALELADALTALDHDVTVIAPDTTGAGFFRRTHARQLTFPAAVEHHLPTLVGRRVGEIAAFVQSHGDDYDIWHAHCSITANALLRLEDSGRIPSFVRTVHHLDDFTDPRLDRWQTDGIRRAARLLTVSQHVGSAIRQRFRRGSTCVGNGVDGARFTPQADRRGLAARLGLDATDDGPIFLSIGGIERRKNSGNIGRAFLRLRADCPARLIVAGGASLLDHGEARAEFASVLDHADCGGAVFMPGVIDDADMPALYRLADALVFTSVEEGFGLCPLEAMSCATPVIVSRIAPFTEHFADDECLWADPHDVASIEAAMRAALDPRAAHALRSSGPATAARFSWTDIARRHLDHYRVRSPAHA